MRRRWQGWITGLAMLGSACAGASPDPRAIAADLPSTTAEPEARTAAAALATAAIEALDAEQLDRAVELATRAVALDPRSGRALAVLAHRRMRDALRERPPELAAWRPAEGELLRATALAPDDPAVARLHATFLIADGHPTAAAERAESGLRASPEDSALLALAGRLRHDLGDEAAALPLLRRQLAAQPDDADALWRLAQCEARLATAEIEGAARTARRDAAIDAFVRYRALRPADVEGTLGEAQVRLQAIAERSPPDPRGIDTILALYDAARAAAPGSPEPWFGRAVTLEIAGRDDDARAAYRMAIDLDADHLPSLLNLAASLAAAGDDGAEPLLRRALELDLTPDERARITAFLTR